MHAAKVYPSPKQRYKQRMHLNQDLAQVLKDISQLNPIIKQPIAADNAVATNTAP